ncbi:MAG: hypothetical protein V1921_08380 [Candidatus Altiarchaeota archaeon]
MEFQIQILGLVFLLGSLTVAALSDIRRMSAQRDFAEVWAAYTLVVLLYDAVTYSGEMMVIVKWLMIVAFFVIVTKFLGNRVSLSIMDLAAVAAVSSMLSPQLILAYYVILLFSKELLNPLLRKFGDGGAVPFLPVVWLSTVGIAILAYST